MRSTPSRSSTSRSTWLRSAFLTGMACLLGLLPSGDLLAQQVSGHVVDKEGGPLPGVNVVVEGTTRGTATDLDGRYVLERLPEGMITLRFSAIGFVTEHRTVKVTPDRPVTLDITLSFQTLLADEIIVTASRREQPALSVPVSVSVLSADELNRRNTVILDEALRTVSGVNILGNQITVRGSSGFAYNIGSRVLLMLDGMPLLTPDSDGVPLEALPTSEIRQIEVLKGPGSALYGSGALGGVINVITREMPDSASTTRIRSFAGVWDPVRYKVWRDGWTHGDEYRPFWGVSASHAMRTSSTFAWWTSISMRRDAGYTALSGRDVFHGFAKTSWRPTRSLTVETLMGIMARQRDNFVFWESARNVLTPGRISFGDAPDPNSSPNGAPDDFIRQISFLPVVRHVVSSTFLHEFRLRGFATLVQPIDDQTGERKALSDGTLGARYGGEWQANWFPTADRRFVFGLSRDAITTKSTFFVTNDGDELGGQPEMAAFIHMEQGWSEDWQLVGGLRFDHYRIDARDVEYRLSPKISVAWTGIERQTFRMAFGDGFRVPSFAERFTDNRDYLPIIRNLELRPETSRSLEFGWRGVTTRLLPGAMSWDISLFRNTYRGFIEPRLVPAEQAFQFINLDRARITGVETMLEWTTPTENWRTSLGYTLLDTEEGQSGQALPFRSRHQVVGTIETRIAAAWRIGADMRYISEPERLESDFARFITDANIMVDTKVLDLRASWQKGPFRTAILVQNALEYHYVDRPAILGEPRRFTLQLEWTR